MELKNDKLSRTIRRLLNPALAAAVAVPGAALAGPLGGEVIRGQAVIGNLNEVTTLVSQTSDRAVVNWQSFSVGEDEFVIFNQPSASSVILNRVIGNNASEILGGIEANGRVFLVNPNGIFFGEGATLDVAGLVASTLDIDSDDFMDGRYVFARAEGAADGEVRNAGAINAADGGFVVLAGDYVENTGVIAARLGHVVLASGSEVTLDLDGSGLIGFAVDGATLANLAGVRNAGEILAEGGLVIMTAQVARALVSTVVNNEGLVLAQSVAERGGVIYLNGAGGHIENSGALVADAADGSGADGGAVIARSDHDITLASGGIVSADGGAGARGGAIWTVAEGRLSFEEGASISAQGGAQGGFVELSGHASIGLAGEVTIGNGGTLLIDPETLTIVTGSGIGGDPTDSTVGVEFIEDQLAANTHVWLIAEQSITADPGVTSIAASGYGGNGDLNIVIGTVDPGTSPLFSPVYDPALNDYLATTSTCQQLGVCDVAAHLVTLTNPEPGGEVLLGHVDITTGGSLHVDAMEGTVELGNVTAGGNIVILGAHTVATGAMTTPETGPGTAGGGYRYPYPGGQSSWWEWSGYQPEIGVDPHDPGKTALRTITIVGSNGFNDALSIETGDLASGLVHIQTYSDAYGPVETQRITVGDVTAQSVWIHAQADTDNAIVIETGKLTLTAADAGFLADNNAFPYTGTEFFSARIGIYNGYGGYHTEVITGDIHAPHSYRVAFEELSALTTGDITVGGAVNLYDIGTADIGDVTVASGYIEAYDLGTLTAGDMTAGNIYIQAMDDIETGALSISNQYSAFIDVITYNGTVSTGDLSAIAGGYGSIAIHAEGDVETGSIYLRGMPTDPVSTDSDGFAMQDTFMLVNSIAGSITVDGDIDVATLDDAGTALAQLVANHGNVDVTGDIRFETGWHPLLLGVISPPIPPMHDFAVWGRHITVGGEIHNNFSLRLTADDTGSPGDASITTGDIFGRRLLITSHGDASFGDIEASRSISINTAGDISVGDISVTGPDRYDSPDLPEHAAVQVILDASPNGDIDAGDISVHGWRVANLLLYGSSIDTGSLSLAVTHPYHWDSTEGGPDWLVGTAFYVPWSTMGNSIVGSANLSINGDTFDGVVTIDGDIDIQAVGGANFMVNAAEFIVTGAVDIEVTGATVDGQGVLTPDQWTDLNGAEHATVATTGRSYTDINALDRIEFGGTVSVTAPSVHMNLMTYSLETQALSLTGTGEDIDITVHDGSTQLGVERRVAGVVSAQLGYWGGSAQLGAVSASGSGEVDVTVLAGDVTASSFTVASALGSAYSDGLIRMSDRDEDGAWQYGHARLALGTGSGDISVAGGIALSGFGMVELDIDGYDVSVGGAISVNAGLAQVAYTERYEDFDYENSEMYSAARTFSGTQGFADAVITGWDSVQLSSVTVTGGEASLYIDGGDVQTGNLTAAATGVSLGEQVVWTRISDQQDFTLRQTLSGGPASVHAGGMNVTTGTVTVSGIGAGMALLHAEDALSVGGLDLTVGGNATFTTADTRRSPDTVTALDGGVAIAYVAAGFSAVVGGDLNIVSSGDTHAGVSATVAGTAVIEAAGAIQPQPAQAFADAMSRADIAHPFDDPEDDFATLPPLVLHAGNIAMNAGTLLDLSGASLNASALTQLQSGGDILVSGALIAGTTLVMQAGGDIVNATGTTLYGGAMLLEAAGDMALGDTFLNIGTGALAGVDGDAPVIDALAEHGLAEAGTTPSGVLRAGGTIDLGVLRFNGDYLLLEASGFALGEFEGPEHAFILQVAPSDQVSAMLLQGSAPDAVGMSWPEFLSLFDDATFVIGGSEQDGDISLGQPVPLDFGDANVMFATNGRMPNLDDVVTNGLIMTLVGVLERDDGFQVPTDGEIRGSEPGGEEMSGILPRRALTRDDDEDDDEGIEDEGRFDDDPGSDNSVIHESDSGLMCE